MKCPFVSVVVGLLVLLLASSPVSAITFVPWTAALGGNGHTYGLTDSPLNWTDAESAAVALGGHLVSVNSAAEQAFLETTFLTDPYPNQPLWIGLTDIPNGMGSMIYDYWTTGEPVTYTNWQTGEPNNYANFEDYVAMNWTYAIGYPTPPGTWNDTGLDGTAIGPYYGIIELPEPSAAALVLVGVLSAAARRRTRKGD